MIQANSPEIPIAIAKLNQRMILRIRSKSSNPSPSDGVGILENIANCMIKPPTCQSIPNARMTMKDNRAQFLRFKSAKEETKVNKVTPKNPYMNKWKYCDINFAMVGASPGIKWNSSPLNMVETIITCIIDTKVAKPAPTINIQAKTVTNVDLDSTYGFSFYT